MTAVSSDQEAPELLASEIQFVPIGSIEPHPDNPNEGDVGAIAESIGELGFFDVILVQRSTGRILSGEHRWRALQSMGSTVAPVVYLDVDDERALRILIGANEIARRTSRPDERKLAELLTDLRQQTKAGVRGTGFDDSSLDRLLAGLRTEVHRTDGGQDAKDRMTSFQASEVRQVVLIMDVETFERSVRIMRRMRDTEGALDDNTACVVALLDRWDADHPAS